MNLAYEKIAKYERNNMPSRARPKKNRKIKQGPKMLNFGATKTWVGGSGPLPDLYLVNSEMCTDHYSGHDYMSSQGERVGSLSRGGNGLCPADEGSGGSLSGGTPVNRVTDRHL